MKRSTIAGGIAAATAAHEAEVPAALFGHHFKDQAGLAMPARAQNDAFVTPFHG